PDALAVRLHQLPRADLAGLAQLHRAIHAHGTSGDQRLSSASAVHHATQLEQLVEFDVVALELELDLIHWQRRRPAGSARYRHSRRGSSTAVRLRALPSS